MEKSVDQADPCVSKQSKKRKLNTDKTSSKKGCNKKRKGDDTLKKSKVMKETKTKRGKHKDANADSDKTKKKKKKRKRQKILDLKLDTAFNIDLCSNESTHGSKSKETDDYITSQNAMRQYRNEMHVTETKDAASAIFEECKRAFDDDTIMNIDNAPALSAAKCNNFINNLVHSNRMMDYKINHSNSTHEFVAEPVKRQWEESFLHEPTEKQCACVNFKLGQCIATELYSNVHGTDFTLREYFTPREMAQLCSNNKGKHGEKSSTNAVKQTNSGTTCLLCRRHDVLASILIARSKGEQIASSIVVPNMANFVNIKGEYELSNVVYNLPSRYEGMLDPIAMVNMRYFEPFMQNGVRWLRQVIPYAKGDQSASMMSNHF